MTAIVCTTGPLIALAGIERLDILRGMYEAVYLPQAVHDEILHGGRHFTGLDAYRKADWITVSALRQPGDPVFKAEEESGRQVARRDPPLRRVNGAATAPEPRRPDSALGATAAFSRARARLHVVLFLGPHQGFGSSRSSTRSSKPRGDLASRTPRGSRQAAARRLAPPCAAASE